MLKQDSTHKKTKAHIYSHQNTMVTSGSWKGKHACPVPSASHKSKLWIAIISIPVNMFDM